MKAVDDGLKSEDFDTAARHAEWAFERIAEVDEHGYEIRPIAPSIDRKQIELGPIWSESRSTRLGCG